MKVRGGGRASTTESTEIGVQEKLTVCAAHCCCCWCDAQLEQNGRLPCIIESDQAYFELFECEEAPPQRRHEQAHRGGAVRPTSGGGGAVWQGGNVVVRVATASGRRMECRLGAGMDRRRCGCVQAGEGRGGTDRIGV